MLLPIRVGVFGFGLGKASLTTFPKGATLCPQVLLNSNTE
jgi:hypothetical protein